MATRAQQLELGLQVDAAAVPASAGVWRQVDAAAARSREHFERTAAALERLGWRLFGVDDAGMWRADRPKARPLVAATAEGLISAAERRGARRRGKARSGR